MMHLILLILFSKVAFTYQISSISIGGEKGADIFFRASGSPVALPALTTHDNVIELSFSGAELAESLQEKVDLISPHPLIHRISSYPLDKGLVRSRVVMNGSVEGLRQRTVLVAESDGIRLSIGYPQSESSAINLLKAEQTPLKASLLPEKKVGRSSHLVSAGIFLACMAAFAIAGFFLLRALKMKGRARGTRKYLIEQLSYCPVGSKSGIALIKVGTEFVLVGITPHQISALTSLPKLQEQYAGESRFERGAFQEAFDQEFNRQKNTPTISV